MSVLYRIAQLLARRGGQHETLQEILGVLDQQLGLIRGTVMLLAPDGQQLRGSLQRGQMTQAWWTLVEYRPGEGITGVAFASGTAVIVPSIAAGETAPCPAGTRIRARWQ